MATLTAINKSILSNHKMQDKENFSARLTHAMRTLDISQSELARRIGVKPQAIQYLCTSNATRSKFAFDIADALRINADWLVAGQGKMMEHRIAECTTRTPLIDWSQILFWLENGNVDTATHVTTQLNLSKKCYAVKINESSMTPRFEIGTVLIIDPETVVRENDYVIVATKFSEAPIIRQLIRKNEKLNLVPANTMLYKEITLSEDDKFLGVLRQTFYEFVRR